MCSKNVGAFILWTAIDNNKDLAWFHKLAALKTRKRM